MVEVPDGMKHTTYMVEHDGEERCKLCRLLDGKGT